MKTGALEVAAVAPEQPLVIHSRDEAEAAVAIYTGVALALQAAVNAKNAEALKLKKLDEPIADCRKRLERYAVALEAWARKNRRREFGPEGQTLELRQGVLRFKLGNRAVCLARGWTEELALAALRKLKRWREYIRVTEAIDRQRILSDSKPEVGRLKEAELEKVGLVIERGESFLIEPRLEAVPS